MTLRLVFDPAKTQQLLSNLERLPNRVRIKHLRIGLNAWGGVVRDAARAIVRRETGLLKKSLSVKVTIPDASFNSKHHGKPAYVLVGPARRSGRFMRVNKAGKLRGFGAAQRALVAERKRLASGKIGPPLQRERAAVKAVQSQFTEAQYRNPTRYAHLVERRYPFLGPAERVGEGAGMAKLAQKLEQGIAAECAALPK